MASNDGPDDYEEYRDGMIWFGVFFAIFALLCYWLQFHD